MTLDHAILLRAVSESTGPGFVSPDGREDVFSEGRTKLTSLIIQSDDPPLVVRKILLGCFMPMNPTNAHDMLFTCEGQKTRLWRLQ
jgi:hypothetical protein